jgi:hypothetical protein
VRCILTGGEERAEDFEPEFEDAVGDRETVFGVGDRVQYGGRMGVIKTTYTDGNVTLVWSNDSTDSDYIAGSELRAAGAEEEESEGESEDEGEEEEEEGDGEDFGEHDDGEYDDAEEKEEGSSGVECNTCDADANFDCCCGKCGCTFCETCWVQGAAGNCARCSRASVDDDDDSSDHSEQGEWCWECETHQGWIAYEEDITAELNAAYGESRNFTSYP